MVVLPVPFSPTCQDRPPSEPGICADRELKPHLRCRSGTPGQPTGSDPRRGAGPGSSRTLPRPAAGWEETASQSYLGTCNTQAGSQVRMM